MTNSNSNSPHSNDDQTSPKDIPPTQQNQNPTECPNPVYLTTSTMQSSSITTLTAPIDPFSLIAQASHRDSCRDCSHSRDSTTYQYTVLQTQQPDGSICYTVTTERIYSTGEKIVAAVTTVVFILIVFGFITVSILNR
ncbi:hypothetical protein NEHOM01_0170 [Nematocida homosporus]|uniref:uncharacterized protein n=1 Tax=Nematocida homosporus TaxID=1912981 RepID=UPI00221FF84C|nr:uncharacterized protein NEHOM01_0170 [Nematocida homosporus]KAI5184425.1 hypothetical protein NEHOM01_0170 [Nematocida homosporus]